MRKAEFGGEMGWPRQGKGYQNEIVPGLTFNPGGV
jgi:hypothetical protein